MADSDQIYVGDEGTIFEVTLTESGAALDVSGATDLKIKFLKPDGTLVEKDAVLVTDGTDGKIAYTTLASDLDQDDSWEIQAWIRLPSGAWHSTSDRFTVYLPIGA